MDQLAPLFTQISLSARVFFTGELRSLANFDESETAGQVHIMKSGRVSITVRNQPIAVIEQPAVVFFPRPCPHTLIPIDEKGCELLCASVDLGG